MIDILIGLIFSIVTLCCGIKLYKKGDDFSCFPIALGIAGTIITIIEIIKMND